MNINNYDSYFHHNWPWKGVHYQGSGKPWILSSYANLFNQKINTERMNMWTDYMLCPSGHCGLRMCHIHESSDLASLRQHDLQIKLLSKYLSVINVTISYLGCLYTCSHVQCLSFDWTNLRMMIIFMAYHSLGK